MWLFYTVMLQQAKKFRVQTSNRCSRKNNLSPFCHRSFTEAWCISVSDGVHFMYVK